MKTMAALCVELHMAPPDYWRLTYGEFVAIVDELNRRAAEAKRAQRG